MSMAKDCSTPVLSNVAVVVEGDENEIELSLGLSIGRGVGSWPNLEISGENFGAGLTDVVVTTPDMAKVGEIELSLGLSIGRGVGSWPNLEISGENFGAGLTDVVVTTPDMAKVGDSEQEIVVSQQGDTEGNNQERKRKRPETLPMNGYYEIGEGSNKRETIGRKSLTDGEISSSDAQVFSMQVPQQNVGGILRLGNQESVTGGGNGSGGILEVNISPAGSSSMPVPQQNVSGILRLGNQELVTGGGNGSGGILEVNISPAGSSSVPTSGFKSNSSQQVGSSESGTGPMGIHNPITPSEVIGSSSSCHPPPPSPTNSTQSEEPDTNLRMFRPPRIPYVTATGNGPNGREVNGFLYKYSNEELSIICACHGRSFSPAQFVIHAGGVDTTHPLRYIVVQNTAFIPFPS